MSKKYSAFLANAERINQRRQQFHDQGIIAPFHRPFDGRPTRTSKLGRLRSTLRRIARDYEGDGTETGERMRAFVAKMHSAWDDWYDEYFEECDAIASLGRWTVRRRSCSDHRRGRRRATFRPPSGVTLTH